MEESVYYTRLTSLLFNTCSNVIRALLPFLVLNEKSQTYTSVNDFVKKKKKEITNKQVGNRNYNSLFPTGGHPTDINSWDLQLLCFMIYDIFQPNQMIKQDIESLRDVRNYLCHVSSTYISEDRYELILRMIKAINDRLLQTIGDGDLTKNIENQTEDIINDRLDIAGALNILQGWLERDKSLQDESCSFTAVHIQALDTVKNRATADTDINIPETKLVIRISNCIKEKEEEICRKIADAITMTVQNDGLQFQPDDGDTRMKAIIANTLRKFLGEDLEIKGASLGCVIITVKTKSIYSLMQLWTKCVNGEITKTFMTLQAHLREAYKNEVNIEVILPEIEFWEVINKIAAELKVELHEGTRLELPEHMCIAKASARSCLEGKLIQSLSVNGAEIEMILRPQSEMQLEHMKSFSASGQLNESFRKMAKNIGQQLKQENLTILPTFSVLETKEQMRNRSNGNTDSKVLPLQEGRTKHIRYRLDMERTNYDRKHRIVLETGMRILRYVIKTESHQLKDPDLETFLLRQNRKNSKTIDIDEMDLSDLHEVFKQMQKELSFNNEIVKIVSFLKTERNSLSHIKKTEVVKSDYEAFLSTFEIILNEAAKSLDDEFVKDLKDFIKEIKTSNKKCQDVETSIDVQEFKSLPKDECLRTMKEITVKIEADGNLIATLDFETSDKNIQDKWNEKTEDGKLSIALQNVIEAVETTGVKHVNTVTNSLLLEFRVSSSEDCFKFFKLITEGDIDKYIKKLESEMSEYSGKRINIYLKAIHLVSSPKKLGADGKTTLHRSGEKHISIRSFNDKRRTLERWLNKLGQASDKAREKPELWKKLKVLFANIRREINLEQHRLRRVKIFVIGEKDSGAYSFLNFMIGKNIFPAPSATKNAIVLRKGENRGSSSFTKIDQGKLEGTGDIFVELSCELLQDEIEWVVLPESWENIATVEGKLSDADGLLYIVNSGNTSELDKEQLRKISALQRCPVAVILNKWDHADCSFYAEAGSRNNEEIEKHIISHIRRFLPYINESRTQRFSVMQARGYTGRYDGMDVNQEYNAKQLLQDLMENSVENRMYKTQRWISDRASQMKMCIKEVTANETKVVEQLTEKENEFKRMSDKKKQFIEEDVRRKTMDTAKNIADHVKSLSVREEMSKWEYSDFPCSLIFDSRETMRYEVNKVVTSRLGKIIARDKKLTLQNYRKEMISVIQHETDEIKGSLKEYHIAVLHQIAGLNLPFTIKEEAFTDASLWGSRLEDFLEVGVMLEMLISGALIALGLLAMPLTFILSLFFESVSSIHVYILKNASKRVIDEIDKYKISEIIEKQLKDLRDCVNEFFINIVPSCTRELSRVKSDINYSIKENQELEKLITFE